MITLIVSLQVEPGHLDEFLAAIDQNAERSFTDEPGCLYFDVARTSPTTTTSSSTRSTSTRRPSTRTEPRRTSRSGAPPPTARRPRQPGEHPCRATVPPRERGDVVKILVLPGDGIGPEITAATVEVLEALDELARARPRAGAARHRSGLLGSHGSTLPDAVLARVVEVDGTVLGPVSHYDYPPRSEGGINPSAELRTRFELFANIRPCRSVDDLSVLRSPMDLVIVRENTEGFYSDRSMHAGSGEFMPDADSAFSLRKVTGAASERVARAAFELARSRRRHVTAVHKANVLKLSDGLFLESPRSSRTTPTSSSTSSSSTLPRPG